MSTENENQMQIELTPEMADGIYSNLAVINHSPSEFVLDFIQMMPGVPKARVKARVILTPQHAKRLIKAMEENVLRYEATHGTISESEQPQIPIQFGGPTGFFYVFRGPACRGILAALLMVKEAVQNEDEASDHQTYSAKHHQNNKGRPSPFALL